MWLNAGYRRRKGLRMGLWVIHGEFSSGGFVTGMGFRRWLVVSWRRQGFVLTATMMKMEADGE